MMAVFAAGCTIVSGPDGGELDASVPGNTVDAGEPGDGGVPVGTVDAGSHGDGGFSDVRSIDARSSGGFGVGVCPVDGGSFSGDAFDAGLLDYAQCQGTSRTVRSGSKALSSDNLAALRTSLGALVVDASGCGADKPMLVLDVSTATTTVRYKDSFYACGHEDGVTYVDHIDGVFSLLGQLAQ
jgi:hypothetical protein